MVVVETRMPSLNGRPLHVAEGLTVRLTNVQPRQAEEWLKKNHPDNRPVNRTRVRQYAADMKARRWRLSDQMISFDVNDRLINGQYRLHACVLAETPFPALVLWGLPAESFEVLDGGKKRSTEENLTIAGRDAPKGAGATARRVMSSADIFSHRRDAAAYRRTFSDIDVIEFLERHGPSVEFAHKHLPRGKTATATIRGAVCRAHACHARKRGLLAGFCATLMTGIMPDGMDAAVLVRNLIVEQHKGSKPGHTRDQIYRLCEAALASVFAGERPKKLVMAKEELFPLPDEGFWNEALLRVGNE
jgi:hypothetical protein